MASPNPPDDEKNKRDSATHEEPASKNVTDSDEIVPISGHVEGTPASPAPRKNEHCTDEEQYRRKQLFWQRLTTIFTGLASLFTLGAFIAAAFYACLAHQQVRGIVRQNKQAARQFKATERPYVTIGRQDGTFMVWKTLACDKVGIVSIFFQNTGNTVARNFHVWAWLSIGLGQVKLPTDPWNHAVHNWPIPILGPKNRAVEYPSVTTIGAHSIWIDYAYTETVLSDATVNAIHSTDTSVDIYGFYEYSDGSGDYWCEPIHAHYASGQGSTIMEGFSLSKEPFTASLCRGHIHEEK